MPTFSLFVSKLSFEGLRDCLVDRFIEQIELYNDVRIAFQKDGRSVYRTTDIYDAPLWGDKDYEGIAYEKPSPIPHDHKKVFMKLIDRAKDSVLSEEELLDIFYETEEDVISILAVSPPDSVAPIQQIESERKAQLHFRFFVGKYPVSEEQFAFEVERLFDKIVFTTEIENCLRTLEGGLDKFSVSIIRALEHLNDSFPQYHLPTQRKASLKRLSSESGFETTPEGNPSAERKKELSFLFDVPNENGDVVDTKCIYCEPHMKFSRSDASGDSHHYVNRLYFREQHPDFPGRLLIGHIGEHI